MARCLPRTSRCLQSSAGAACRCSFGATAASFTLRSHLRVKRSNDMGHETKPQVPATGDTTKAADNDETPKLSRKDYEKALRKLQTELAVLQDWVKRTGER